MAFVQLAELLDEVYRGQDRLTPGDIHRAALEAELPADLMQLIDGLPEGEYSEDEAADALRQVPNLLTPGDGSALSALDLGAEPQ
jgi:hypothetical protein